MTIHRLIKAGAGIGLMAGSLVSGAQTLQTFDYSMLFLGNAPGGYKYVAFMPTLMLRSGTDGGSANVLMLEFFAPTASGTVVNTAPSTWSFVLGGAVTGVNIGGSGTVSADISLSTGANTTGSYSVNQTRYFGNLHSIAHSFTHVQNAGLGTATTACNVTFSADINAQNDLQFKNVVVRAAGLSTANAAVTLTTGAAAATVTIASDVWNNASVTLPTYAFASVAISGSNAGGNWATASATGSGSLAVQAQIRDRNACVPIYTARAGVSTANTITGGAAPAATLTRIY